MIWKTIASTFALAGFCCLVSAPSAIAQGAAQPPAQGQNPPGGFGGPGAGMQMPPEMQAKLKAWKTWNNAHKPISDLQMMLLKVERLEKEPGAELTKPQANQLLAIIKPWRTKKEMTNDQASAVMKSVSKLLTPTQVAKLATMQGRGGGGDRRGAGGPGMAGGGPGRPGMAGGGPGRPGMAGPGPAPKMSGGAPGGPAGRPGGMGAESAGGRMGGRPAGGPGGPGGFKIPDPPKTGFNPLNPATLPFERQRPRAQKNLDEFTAALQAKAK